MSSAQAPRAFYTPRRMPARRRRAKRSGKWSDIEREVAELQARGVDFEDYDMGGEEPERHRPPAARRRLGSRIARATSWRSSKTLETRKPALDLCGHCSLETPMFGLVMRIASYLDTTPRQALSRSLVTKGASSRFLRPFLGEKGRMRGFLGCIIVLTLQFARLIHEVSPC
jgi:hypothetical protein